MIRMLMLTTALAASAPVFAQQTMSPAAPDTAPAPASSPTPAEPAPQAQTAPNAAKPANPTDAVASIVDTEFPAYDGNKDGQLDQSEFSRWMMALKDQEMKATGKTLPQDQVMAWASGAFITADADKNVSISKPELITYLSGGAA